MTAGAMGQIYAQNQGQAGNAYARAQQRAQALQQQGIDMGFDRTDKAYAQGLDAKDRYTGSVKDIQDTDSKYYADQGKFRDEQAGYAGDRLGVSSGYNSDMYNMDMETAGVGRDAAYAKGTRDLGAIGQQYNVGQAAANNEIQGKNDANTSKVNTAGTVATAVASDKRSKKGISDISDNELDEFLSAVKPKTFDYKNPETSGTAGGRRVGFMMQDVDDTKLGKAITRKTPDGKMAYDKENLNSIMLAALAREHQRKRA
jgi:hypothetical protein